MWNIIIYYTRAALLVTLRPFGYNQQNTKSKINMLYRIRNANIRYMDLRCCESDSLRTSDTTPILYGFGAFWQSSKTFARIFYYRELIAVCSANALRCWHANDIKRLMTGR
uniref:Uncharacterized protein n=1 Tax=Schizaphis graminum TaxID=13262 RepID=A0A2S2PCN1_SCHGA